MVVGDRVHPVWALCMPDGISCKAGHASTRCLTPRPRPPSQVYNVQNLLDPGSYDSNRLYVMGDLVYFGA